MTDRRASRGRLEELGRIIKTLYMLRYIDDLLGRGSRVLVPALVVPVDVTVSVGDPRKLRNRICHRPEPLLAFLENLLPNFIRDVFRDEWEADGAARRGVITTRAVKPLSRCTKLGDCRSPASEGVS